MIQVPYVIEDAHGNTYPNAVVVVCSSHYHNTQNRQISVNIENRSNVEVVSQPEQSSIQLNFNAYLFRDLDAFQSNKKPMMLRASNGNEWFSFPVEAALNSAEAQVTAAETYIQNVILPTLRVEVTE